MFAAVDIWDALRFDRPYRTSWLEARVCEHIASLAGTHLDPAVVAAFLRIIAAEVAAVTDNEQVIELKCTNI